MTEAAARQRIDSWLAPISPANPTGEDARYDPLHEEIRNEAAKVDSPSSGTTDWVKLAVDAERLTTEQAKDLLIESYAAYALFQNEGLLGLASGLFLLSESMDRYWDDMYPPARRIRARVNAIAWLTEKLDTTLSETQVGADDHDALDALEAAVNRFRAVVADKFTDQAPAVRPIFDSVQRLKMALPERAAPPVASDTEPPPAPAPAEAAPGPADAAAPPAATPSAPDKAAPPAATPSAPDKKEASADELWAEILEKANEWCEPIPGDAPAGTDAKYEPSHEELRGDITAADSPTGSNLDWSSVVGRAGGILKQQSKDLLIATYLAFALWERDRLEGLAVGLAVLQQICERYWDDSFPPARRIRGRANVFAWLLDRLETPLPDTKLTVGDRKAVALLAVSVARFAATVREKFGDAAPSVRPLEDNVKRLEISVPAPEAPKPAPSPKPTATVPASTPKASAPSAGAASVGSGAVVAGDLGDPKEVAKFTRDISKSLSQAARSIRKESPKDPLGYQLGRLAAAVVLKVPAATNNETRIPAPPSDALSDIERVLAKEDWESLLKRAEAMAAGKPMWLDPHRFSAIALSNLGEGYEEALAAVLAGTAYLVKRYPMFLDYTFEGGMPLASDLTKAWIGAEVMPSGGGGGGGGGEGADVLASGRNLAAGGKMAEALAELEGLAFGARSARARFQARLVMAQAFGEKSPATSDGIYEALAGEIATFGIEGWEPELAAECYRGHLSCLKRLDKDAGGVERARIVYSRLCRVDPVGASNMSID